MYLVISMDDTLVFRKTNEKHLGHLETILNRLKPNNCMLQKMRVILWLEWHNLLNHLSEGMVVNPYKVEVIRSCPRTTKLTESKSFLGLLQFLRRFKMSFSAASSSSSSYESGKGNAEMGYIMRWCVPLPKGCCRVCSNPCYSKL